MQASESAGDRRTYVCGQLIAVLEQAARLHGEIPHQELYYLRGFLPRVGLREPLLRHRHSVRPRLETLGRSERYMDWLEGLVRDLQAAAGIQDHLLDFEGWVSELTGSARHPQDCGLPDSQGPEAAVSYAQGYLEERRKLQPGRPAAPEASSCRQYYWDYHQGRQVTWNVPGNDPKLSPALQLGLADRRALAAIADGGSRPAGQRPRPGNGARSRGGRR